MGKARQTQIPRGQPRQTEIMSIADPQKRRVAFSKRYPTLFQKAEQLAILTSSDLFLRVRSSTGRNFFCSYQRGERIASNVAPGTGKVNSSTGPRGWEDDLVKHECDACTTKEDFQSVIANCEARLAYASERLEKWENSPPVIPDEEIDSLLESFKASNPSLWALCKDSVSKVGRESFWSSLYNSVAGDASNSTCSGLDGSEFNLDVFLDVYDNCTGDRPESSTVGGGLNHLDDFSQLENLEVDL